MVRKKRRRKAESALQPKGPNHGKLWTPEEQTILERLLEKYPEEEISAHRWEKISRELGNRTPKQVASRVQKYFIQLAKAGLPVPGKLPNMETYSKKKVATSAASVLGISRPNKVTIHTRDIAYFEAPPIPMPSDQVILASTLGQNPSEVYITNSMNDIHVGFQCDICKVHPIQGTRWTCTDCFAPSVHLCNTCAVATHITTILPSTSPTTTTTTTTTMATMAPTITDSTTSTTTTTTTIAPTITDSITSTTATKTTATIWSNPSHSATHNMEKIDKVQLCVDPDYIDGGVGSDNPLSYLDPNFMPV